MRGAGRDGKPGCRLSFRHPLLNHQTDELSPAGRSEPRVSVRHVRALLLRCLGGPTELPERPGQLLSRSQPLWAGQLAAPLSIPITLAFLPDGHVGTNAWLGFAYVSAFSMFLGFFAWYAGLALGGVAKAGQTQLLQTPLTLVLAALVLGEHVTVLAMVCTLAVLASIVGTQRARVERR
jgi:drug/metabolite transporter (DMT)-like permease